MIRVHIIGAGLLGGSMGLALAQSGWEVSLEDDSSEATEAALRTLSINDVAVDTSQIEVVVVAVPISANKATISKALSQYPNAIVMDIASVKTNSLPDVYGNAYPIERFVSTHPFAGKEVRGAENASVDLFRSRMWAICTGAYLSERAKKTAEMVIRDCGGITVEIALEKHDHIVGFTSHLPQILSTLLISQLKPLPDSDLRLSGNGLKDMTRLASSSADLWSEIVLNNSVNLYPILESMEKTIEAFNIALRNNDEDVIKQFFIDGNTQKARLPGKHGDNSKRYNKIEVQILDKPGELAGIFTLAFSENVNIEDIRINHALGRDIAILEIYVSPDAASEFTQALQNHGWHVRSNLTQGDL